MGICRVYCPKPSGCDNGYGSISPWGTCDLKVQPSLPYLGYPQSYGRGNGAVDFTSGITIRAHKGKFFLYPLLFMLDFGLRPGQSVWRSSLTASLWLSLK